MPSRIADESPMMTIAPIEEGRYQDHHGSPLGRRAPLPGDRPISKELAIRPRINLFETPPNQPAHGALHRR
jgi:hypothetical protein